MINPISIIIALLIYIYKLFRVPFLLLITVILIYIVIKEIKNRKYSRNPFRNIKEKTEIDYVVMVINELKIYKKTIIKNDEILLISQKGIFFLKVLNYKDRVSGNLDSKYFDLELGIKKYKIRNKIINYEKEYIEYKKLIEKEIKKYIVIRNDNNLIIKDLKDIKIVNLKKLYYELDKYNIVYTKKQVDTIYNNFTL